MSLTPPDGRDVPSRRSLPMAILMGLLSVSILGLLFTNADILAAETSPAQAPSASDDAELPMVALDPDDPYTLSSLDIHPDRLFGQYFAGAFSNEASIGSAQRSSVANDFSWRLKMYEDAYGTDDNFTVRVLDNRTGKTLEIATLRAQRDLFRGSGQASWDEANRGRRTLSRTLRDKWVANGMDLDDIVIRWGYKNQSHEARMRDQPYLSYEVNLARRLGLSVLATEIGTVETFNQDELVSSAGARSRFQMMPDILSLFDVERYTLATASGRSVEVAEELHPLLAMEPSLMLVRAYSNSVGHELPGVSAYHTGPGNIFKLYNQYLRAHPGRVRSQGQHVSDAYMWGVTEGFERVDAVSSFGPQSRAYVLKAYGALRATENEPVDPDETFRGERVQIQPGKSIQLSRLLTALEANGQRLDWSIADARSLYERFRTLNPHIKLAPAPGGGVPATGDIRLVRNAGNDPVRFFLPLGATAVLRRVGLDVIGDIQTFDADTFLPKRGEIQDVDRRYMRLVEDTGRFGFTNANARKLDRIYDELSALASRNPDSRYRQTQAKIARIHKRVWGTRDFRSLVATTEATLSMDPRVAAGREPITSLTPVPPPALPRVDTTAPARPAPRPAAQPITPRPLAPLPNSAPPPAR